jgi:hypothetical protein
MNAVRRFVTWFGRVETLTGMHLWLTWFWIVMIIPTALWWRSSIPWVGFMSVWALVATHWSGYQGGRSERLSKQQVVPKLEPIAEIVPVVAEKILNGKPQPLKRCEMCGHLKKEGN